MLNSIINKIEALILALTLFFVGLVYGDKPIEVEFDCELSTYEISTDEFGRIHLDCVNVGRPFEGVEPFHANFKFFKIENGKKVYVRYEGSITVDSEPRAVLVKSGEEFGYNQIFLFPEGTEPGVYSLEVEVYGCEKIYEDVLTIK